MTPPAAATKKRAQTQPLRWDWVTDWAALNTEIAEIEVRQNGWDWQRHLALLEAEMDRLARRVGL